MTKPSFKYDVAFSFLAEDEELATSINELIQDRLTTFIYSKKQEELAGTDGEESFNKVFGAEARIVFVLYRKGWGETPWTRIEETAIKNRAYDDGYDFVIFAPLDKPPTIPKYLPKTRLWVGLDRWGIEGAASIIEARVQETGGAPKEETVEDRVLRLSKEIEAEKEKKNYLNSFDGVSTANREVSKLFSELEKAATSSDDKLYVVSGDRDCAMYGGRFSVYIQWNQTYNNALESSALYISLFEGHIRIRGEIAFPSEKPKRIDDQEYQFDLSKSRMPIWREVRGSKRNYTTEALAKEALTILLNKVLESEKQKK